MQASLKLNKNSIRCRYFGLRNWFRIERLNFNPSITHRLPEKLNIGKLMVLIAIKLMCWQFEFQKGIDIDLRYSLLIIRIESRSQL